MIVSVGRARVERGTLLAQRYEALERLGVGGMGEVWSAHDHVLRREVAVKLLLRVGEVRPEEMTARFEREAVAVAQINHPNVVALHDRGVHDGVLFLVMELVDGSPLSTLIETSGVIAPRRALQLAEQICMALEATHGAGVVHFDIKPRNVMITSAGVVKVVDFGVAGLVRAQQLSLVHSSFLTPAATVEYAAPEQFTEARGDERSDLYALGGVLFTMLTGRAPFAGYNPLAMAAAKSSSAAPTLEQSRPGLPSALIDLVAGLLERDSARRPQSARAVRERLAQLSADLESGDGGTTALEEVPVPVPVSVPYGAGPRQLPPDTRLFTGRADELESLFGLLEQTGSGSTPGTVVISAIDGMGGVGKTALAVRAAHRLAPRFPDGQLFVDLYGFTHGTTPRDPSDALAVLLGYLGVPPQRIPADLEARSAIYRDRLSGTRTLVVLDNAADEAQVRPLLPASDTCLVLVTSRRRLKALDEALPLTLDVLPEADAITLFLEVAGPGRIPADDPLLPEIAALCGRLPLALRIAAALLRASRTWDLRRLADRLNGQRADGRLSGFTDGDRNLMTVFELSLRVLPPDRRRLFLHLGVIPGPDIDAYAAAALLETDPDQAEQFLQDLVDHNLLAEAALGRFQMHDLVRRHARHLAGGEPEAWRAAATERLLGYYQYTAAQADALIARFPRVHDAGPPPEHVPTLPDQDSARAWLRAERANLLACLAYATAEEDQSVRVVALSSGVASLLRIDGPWPEAIAVHSRALKAAEQLGDEAGRAGSFDRIGAIRLLSNDYPGATRDLEAAAGLYRELDDRQGQAGALTSLGAVRLLTGDFAGAARDLETAVELCAGIGNKLGQAHALTELGAVRYMEGDSSHASPVLATALALYRELGDRRGEANVLIRQGSVKLQTGDPGNALQDLERALELHRDLGERLGQAHALTQLGPARAALKDLSGAMRDLKAAIELYRGLGDRTGEGWTLAHYGALLAATGDLDQAVEAYRAALNLARAVQRADGEALALEAIADCLLRRDSALDGIEHLNQARDIYRRLGRAADVERLEIRIAGLEASPEPEDGDAD